MRKPAVNLLLALGCLAVLLVVTEIVLRACYVPPARTLAPLVTTRTTTPEYDVTISTTDLGFRDANPEVPLFPKVAVFGDSFVFGSGVAVRDGLTYRLQAVLKSVSEPVEVWNFGVPGTGPFNALYLWRDHARALRPGVVVVALYAGNDASDALRESKEARPRFVTVTRAKMLWYRIRARWQHRGHGAGATGVGTAQGWNAFGVDNPATLEALLAAARKRGVPADSIRTRLAAVPDSLVKDALAFRSNPFNLAEAVLDPDGLRHNLLLDTPEMNEGWKALESALTQLHQQTDQTNAQLVLVCIPAAVQVDSTYWWAKNLGVRLDDRVLNHTEFQNRLAEFSVRERIPMIDLLPSMRAHPEKRLYYQEDGHWNAAGHDVAARAIAERLVPIILPLQPGHDW